MILKELAISLLNGLVWGGVAGLFAWWLYHSVALGVVMMNAMLLNLLVGALVGILVPMGDAEVGPGPGDRFQRAAHVHHRQHGIFYFPWSGNRLPALAGNAEYIRTSR